MRRPLYRYRWNDAENCPGPTPWAARAWFLFAYPFGVAWVWWTRARPYGYGYGLSHLMWATWYWRDWS